MTPQEKAIGPAGIDGAGLVHCCHWSSGQVEEWQRGGGELGESPLTGAGRRVILGARSR